MEEIKTNDRAEFLKERLSGLGGTDASAIAGLNPYKTALDVYLEKRQLVDPPEENEAMYWGSALEPVVAERYAKETGSKLTRNNCLVVHPEYSFIIGHPDYLITNGNGQVCRGLEVKTAGFHSRHLWGEPGTDDVPKAYMIQVLHYSAILNVPFDLAVLIGGQDFAIYHIDPKPSMIKDLITIEKNFWNTHVLAGIPPGIDGSDSSKKYLATFYPTDRGEAIPADEKA